STLSWPACRDNPVARPIHHDGADAGGGRWLCGGPPPGDRATGPALAPRATAAVERRREPAREAADLRRARGCRERERHRADVPFLVPDRGVVASTRLRRGHQAGHPVPAFRAAADPRRRVSGPRRGSGRTRLRAGRGPIRRLRARPPRRVRVAPLVRLLSVPGRTPSRHLHPWRSDQHRRRRPLARSTRRNWLLSARRRPPRGSQHWPNTRPVWDYRRRYRLALPLSLRASHRWDLRATATSGAAGGPR